MSEIVIKYESFVAVLKSVLIYSICLASKYNVTISQARVTDVVQYMLSSEYLPSMWRQS